MAITDEKFTDLLHYDLDIRPKNVNKLWDIICNNSDGVDVEQVRSDRGLKSKSKERKKIVRRLQFVTKSKLGSLSWDNKQFQMNYIFGISGDDNRIMREGTNKHLIEEVLPEYIDRDTLITKFENTGTIEPYIKELSEQIIIDTVSNSTDTEIKDIYKALGYFGTEEESKNYIHAIDMIALHYQKDFKKLSGIYTTTKAIDYLIPAWQEVVIWDTEEWTNGIVDAIRELPFNKWVPIDYKFGKPKERYYMPGVSLELTFYKHLVMSENAVYAHEYWGEQKPWKPLYTEKGEMWYVLDSEHGILDVKFSDKWDTVYYKAVMEYWNALNNMSYDYQPEYGYQRDRFVDYCNPKENGKWKCEYRSICEQSDSFKNDNLSRLEEDILDDLFEEVK